MENRFRWPLRLASRVRQAWPDKPLFVRISASDWAEEIGPEKGADGNWKWWGIEQSKTFVKELETIGIDLVDVSSGGLYVKQKIPLELSYQVSATLSSTPSLLTFTTLARYPSLRLSERQFQV